MSLKRFASPVLAATLGIALAGCDASQQRSPVSPSAVAVLDSEEPGESSSTDVSGPMNGPSAKAFATELFVDTAAPAHAGPGPHPTTESSDFHLTQGGIRWPAGAPVTYRILGAEPVPGANAAVERAENTWDGFITTRSISRDDGSPSPNPCGGVNMVSWAPIDGPGGTIGTASVCRNVATKEIVGFVITLDSTEPWSTGVPVNGFDVENVASHEWGHTSGLGHGSPPRSGCLTMYGYSSLHEIQKRTLGLGDKLGMHALYNTGDTTPGPGCGQ